MLFLAIISTISTAALAVITFFYARINARMLREMRQAREMDLQPMLSASLIFFRQEELPEGGLNIKAISLRNIGNAPAMNARINSKFSVGEFCKKGEFLIGQMGIEEKKITMSELLMGEQINLAFEMIKEIHKRNDVRQLTFHLIMSYFNSYGIRFETSLVFDNDLSKNWKLTSQEHIFYKKL
jgi:hypothetical protein